jgi:hypothetical protein
MQKRKPTLKQLSDETSALSAKGVLKNASSIYFSVVVAQFLNTDLILYRSIIPLTVCPSSARGEAGSFASVKLALGVKRAHSSASAFLKKERLITGCPVRLIRTCHLLVLLRIVAMTFSHCAQNVPSLIGGDV